MNLEPVARTLFIGAGVLFVAGLLVYGLSKLGVAKLPGDLTFEGKNWKVYFPIATSILLSVVITVVLNLISRWR